MFWPGKLQSWSCLGLKNDEGGKKIISAEEIFFPFLSWSLLFIQLNLKDSFFSTIKATKKHY